MWFETWCLNNLESCTNTVHRWSSSAPRWSLHSLQSQLFLIHVLVLLGRCGEIACPAIPFSLPIHHPKQPGQCECCSSPSIIKAADHICVSVLRHPLKRNNTPGRGIPQREKECLAWICKCCIFENNFIYCASATCLHLNETRSASQAENADNFAFAQL